MRTRASEIIKKKVKIGEVVTSRGKNYSVAQLLDIQPRILSQAIIRGKKGKFIGFEKPDISVYLIHCGKVLKQTARHIGQNYQQTSA